MFSLKNPTKNHTLLASISMGVSLVLLTATLLFGQATNVTQGISGTVQDPSGAAVPGATVTIQNTLTGVVTKTITTQAGIFIFPQLPIGTYGVRVVKEGFKTVERVNVSVVSGQTPDVKIELPVGVVSQAVIVSGAYQPLDVTSTDTGDTRSAAELLPLPVEVNGGPRDPLAYLETFAGVNTTEYGGGAYSNILGTGDNGGFGTVASYEVDGLWANIGSTGSLNYDNRPEPELIQEMRLVTNGNAEVGWNLGVAVQLTTKSGTNKYHGTAWEFLGNNAFDAKDWLAQAVAPNKQHDFGVVFGGPIFKDKHFFIASYSGYRYRGTTSGQVVTVPTSQMTTGDFTQFLGPQLLYSNGAAVFDTLGRPVYQGEIYDPATTRPDGYGNYVRDPFMYQGRLNTIDPARFSKVSSYFQQGFPSPNLPGTGENFDTTTLLNDTDRDSIYIKTDHDFGAHRLSFALEDVLRDGSPACTGTGWVGFGPELNACTINHSHVDRIRVNYNWVIRPNLLLGIHAGFNYSSSKSFPGVGANNQTLAGLTGTWGTAMPVININGFIESIGQPSDQSLDNAYSLPVDSDLTWVKGKHQFKFGEQWMQLYTNENSDTFSNGEFAFNGDFSNLPDIGAQDSSLSLAGGQTLTGVGYAQFLTGYVSGGATVESPYNQQYRSNEFAYYAQDQWRITPRLTINYGLRYNVFFSPSESQNRITSLCLTCSNAAAGGLPGALTFWGKGPGRNGRIGILNVYPWAFDPRFGVAYAINSRTVGRVYWGIQRYPMSGVFGNGTVAPNYGTGAVLSVPGNSPVSPAFIWDQGTFTLPTLPNLNPALENGQAIEYFNPAEDKPGAGQDLGASVERELPYNMYVRAKYVAKLMRGLPSNNLISLNQLPIDAPEKYGDLLYDDVGSAAANAAGIKSPYPGFTGPVWQALSPFPQYGAITDSNALVKNVYYHAAQFELQKSTGGLTFLVAYTISKTLTNDPFPVALGDAGTVPLATQYTGLKNALMPQVGALYGLGGDRPQVLELSWAYKLPVGQGQRFLGNTNKLVDGVLGGWTLSGIQSYQAGVPFVLGPTVGAPTFGQMWSDRVPGVPETTSTTCGSYNPFDSSQPAPLNAAAFVNPFTSLQNFAFGNTLIPKARLCGYMNEDASIQKTFTLHEGYHMQFGIDAFNALNRHQWYEPGLFPTIPSTYGHYSAVTGGRNAQFHVRILF